MIVAIPYENGQIFQHIGHTTQFKLYTIEQGVVSNSQIVPTLGSGHGALAGFLRAQGVDALLCGGIGGGARTALAESGIRLYAGVSGNADQAVEALLSGSLVYQDHATCDHHEHGHSHSGDCGSHAHSCGHHGCGGKGHEG